MKHREDGRTHYKKCSYYNCGLNSRDNVENNSFHCFAINDNERRMTWLVNCGLDDWVEMTNTVLRRKFICSRHFSKDSSHSSGRLRKDAIPYLYSVNNNNTIACLSQEENVISTIKEHDKIKKLENELKREKNKSKILRLQLRTKCRALNRMSKKLSSGDISDSCLKKAIARRVRGFILTFILMQLFSINRKRNYTTKERRLCLTMHYTSPSLYNKMRDILKFHLPSPVTIIRWFGTIDIWPGICQNLFNALAIKTANMHAFDRNCVLLFHEMAIKKCFSFHPSKQIIEGFEDLGFLGRSTAVGTQVLVFMIRGLFSNWKQPIAFFVSKNGVKVRELSALLDAVLDALNEIGLKVRAVVSDQGASNQSMAEGRVNVENPYFRRNGQKIYFLFDYLHLFKSIRNNLLKYYFLINGNRVSWYDVVALWNLERAIKIPERLRN